MIHLNREIVHPRINKIKRKIGVRGPALKVNCNIILIFFNFMILSLFFLSQSTIHPIPNTVTKG